MKILRRNSENLLSILEAFIYDPLINWRLATANDHDGSVSKQDSGAPGARSSVIEVEEEEVVMQLSKSFSKTHTNPMTASQLEGSGPTAENEEEYRNQQGDLALARVRAKLTGQEFGNLSNTSFSLMRTSKPRDSTNFNVLYPFHGSFVDSQNVNLFGETLRDSLSTGGGGYPCGAAGEDDTMDVAQQVDRLIQEATSLQNLSDAYITGWAPFW
ncbi:hypothetical protein STCU_10686 [Strigomonas culicis]|uniref:FATC domain-containing protein n=1 Tax=Strigomonas culicis TaxID=28005 RepID=S9TKF8_9TRYP|nr:hypothetical protein STCU_10686 [Strigomonas culicis]|eukprot:EPY17319.1 hypothetical protein STCU_10686 [Strigomonas culicis]